MERIDFSALYSEEELKRQKWCRDNREVLTYRPLISITVPVYRTPINLLDEMIASVVQQSYDNWELCIVNASPEQKELCRRLSEWQEADERIRVKDLEHNGGISANTNACFEMVRGEYVGMLDHDDLLTENALFEIVWCLQERPELDFLYSDQDMIDENSTKRFNPLYKPEWSQEMLYSGNYITHFSVLRTSLIREIGGWEPRTDGAQDWDLFLKAGEHTDKIHGIEQILYHWRMASTSTATSMETKSYALDAQLRAIKEHLDRKGETQAEVVFQNRDILKTRIKWNREHDRDISVIVLDEGRTEHLKLQVQLIRAALHMNEKEIIVVSADEGRLACLKDAGCKCVNGAFSNWAEGYRMGAEYACGEVLLFCTDGVSPMHYDTFYELADWAKYDRVAVAAPRILKDEYTLRSMGIALTENGIIPMFEGCTTHKTLSNGFVYWYRNISAADYNCFAIRRSLFEEAGGFLNESGAGAMAVFCLELSRRGYRHMVTPYAEIMLKGKTMTEQYDGVDKTICEKYSISGDDKYYR